MFSFEGDYRRKPQQNLAGASRRDEKAVLLQHAQFERSKREQQRKRHNSAVKIQACVRSFMTRKIVHKQLRYEFDEFQRTIRSRNITIDELFPCFQKLLFFYNHNLDADRLIWILQLSLKHQEVIKLRAIKFSDWLWRLR